MLCARGGYMRAAVASAGWCRYRQQSGDYLRSARRAFRAQELVRMSSRCLGVAFPGAGMLIAPGGYEGLDPEAGFVTHGWEA